VNFNFYLVLVVANKSSFGYGFCELKYQNYVHSSVILTNTSPECRRSINKSNRRRTAVPSATLGNMLWWQDDWINLWQISLQKPCRAVAVPAGYFYWSVH